MNSLYRLEPATPIPLEHQMAKNHYKTEAQNATRPLLTPAQCFPFASLPVSYLQPSETPTLALERIMLKLQAEKLYSTSTHQWRSRPNHGVEDSTAVFFNEVCHLQTGLRYIANS